MSYRKCHLKQIKWQFIHSLNKLQEEIGFSFATRLQQKHLFWEKHKMNVKLTAQTLSASIANAIDFLCDELNCLSFKILKLHQSSLEELILLLI